MSRPAYIEALSSDPHVRELHQRAVRILNDPSLDRQQREFHIRQVQSLLLVHQATQAAKAKRLADKQVRMAQESRHNSNQGVAHKSQVAARRRELGMARLLVTPAEIKTQPTFVMVAANDNCMPGNKSFGLMRLVKRNPDANLTGRLNMPAALTY